MSSSRPREARTSDARDDGPRTWLAAGFLFLLSCALYLGVRGHGFLSYDDATYIGFNEHVTDGLGLRGLWWAWTSTDYACNWHPLAWTSHMVDVSLFGNDPAGHHLHSVALHGANAALVFLALRALSGSFWRSLVVGAFFASHPLRVESVAWIAERKDVLCAFWFLLSLLFYERWVRRPGRLRYAAVLLAAVFALAAKPMAVTLPCVLLLLDRWPLARDASWAVLVREKLPLFAASAASALLTWLAQSAGGCTSFIDEGIEAGSRAGNAAIAVWQYVGKTLWPMDLAVFYPHPAVVAPDLERGSTAALALAGLTALALTAWRLRRTQPALGIGLLWFVGMLVPVIGVVQVGGQALADRYAYLPTIGLYVAWVWPLGGLARERPGLKLPLLLFAAALTTFFGALTVRQVPVWRDDDALFSHALEVTERNYVAHVNLGRRAGQAGRLEEAREHFEAAVSFYPRFFESQLNLGLALRLLGNPRAALPHLDAARALSPERANAAYELALARLALGEGDAAGELLLEARELARVDPDAPKDLIGKIDAALGELERSRRGEPRDA